MVPRQRVEFTTSAPSSMCFCTKHLHPRAGRIKESDETVPNQKDDLTLRPHHPGTCTGATECVGPGGCLLLNQCLGRGRKWSQSPRYLGDAGN